MPNSSPAASKAAAAVPQTKKQKKTLFRAATAVGIFSAVSGALALYFTRKNDPAKNAKRMAKIAADAEHKIRDIAEKEEAQLERA